MQHYLRKASAALRIAAILTTLLTIQCLCDQVDHTETVKEFFLQPGHTNNWAVLVCSSRFWFNYRHVSNVLSLYHSIKRLGIPDSNIIMMLSDNMPCNARNPDPGTIYASAYHRENLYVSDLEVDYRGYEVTAESFVRLLTDRVHEATPRNKRLLSDRQSNVLIYLTGHGGDGFLKFQDSEELTNVDLADAIEAMYQQNRYHEMFVIADTCQSASMYQRIYSPNVLATSSSLVGEDSLSHHVDRSIGVYIIDRYSYYIQEFLDGKVLALESNVSMAEYLKACPRPACISTVGVRADLYPKAPERVRVTDFFGARRYVKPLSESYVFDAEWEQLSTDSEARAAAWDF
ncbi:GPI-anchor transamidase [Aphelenchoides avenae]|nr:GPI-anchor transamidase [Aphelenchus avenae]